MVRQKSVGTRESTVDEAAFDMSQMDYDFFVFTDVETGSGALLYLVDGTDQLVLRYAEGAPDDRPKYATAVEEIDPVPAPKLTTEEAIKTLDEGNLSFVFYLDAETEEPSVAYHRYDGDYGLLTARA